MDRLTRPIALHSVLTRWVTSGASDWYDNEGAALSDAVTVRMSDVMSTSVESLMIDVADLDDEPSLVSSEQEPEAWSVTVDLKTLKKMTAKNIKRQDHIWGQPVIALNCRLWLFGVWIMALVHVV